MVKVEDIETMGWRKALKGMRNPLNSWNKIDSEFYTVDTVAVEDRYLIGEFSIGPNDLDLAIRLIKAGPEHRKFLRMIHVQMDITGPLYWWKEMDTYKVATVANSCSTMHKIHSKEFELGDFSCENLITPESVEKDEEWTGEYYDTPIVCLGYTIDMLNLYRNKYLAIKSKPMKDEKARKDLMKKYWWQLIQLLPSSYNQLRTWDGDMETILSILHQRAHHKLDTDWEPFRQTCFDNIPYCKEFYEAMYGKEEN